MNPQPPFSGTARAVLVAAAERTDYRAFPSERLPIAAQRSVVHSLLKAGLIEEAVVDAAEPGWRTDDGGAQIGLRFTAAGLRTVSDALAGAPKGGTAEPKPDETEWLAIRSARVAMRPRSA